LLAKENTKRRKRLSKMVFFCYGSILAKFQEVTDFLLTEQQAID
jgi:hypothetical protein